MHLTDWIGYCEHKSMDRLHEFDENVGKGGYTVFAQMIWARQHRNMQGLPWCATFVHAVIDRPDVLGKAHPGSRVLMRRMKRRGLWRDKTYTPEPMDLVFCANDRKRVDHVAIVEWSDGDTVSSIDGNSHDDKGRFAWQDGGVVTRCIRDISDPIIIGYAATGQFLHDMEVNGNDNHK